MDTNGNERSEPNSDKKNEQPANGDAKLASENNNVDKDAKLASGNDKASKRRARKAKKPKKNLNDPMLIISDILQSTSFKEANLSQLVEKKFYLAADYQKELREQLSDIVYKSTISTKNGHDHSMDCISIVPHNFDGSINPSGSAIMSLTCINDAPVKRRHFRKAKNQAKNKKSINQ